nr:MAG TPA: hypothetical protein [Caudoviricetes sp.]
MYFIIRGVLIIMYSLMESHYARIARNLPLLFLIKKSK